MFGFRIFRSRAAIGAGVSFGKKQMLTLNALLMAGAVDRASVVYNQETGYSAMPEQITVPRLKTEIGISLGYIYKF